MIQTLEDICATENFVHMMYHLRGVINEVGEILVKHHYFDEAVRLDEALSDFGAALEAWGDRLPDEEIEEIEE